DRATKAVAHDPGRLRFGQALRGRAELVPRRRRAEPRAGEEGSVEVGNRGRTVEGQCDRRSLRAPRPGPGLAELGDDVEPAQARIAVERLEHAGLGEVRDHFAHDVAQRRGGSRGERDPELGQALEVVALKDGANADATVALVVAPDQALEHFAILAPVREPEWHLV